MTLAFPNDSRSYDEAGHRIRFVGYDGMFEVRFFVEIEALSMAVAKAISGEGAILAAFDSIRGAILDVAKNAYAHGKGKNMFVLTEADFR